MTAWAAAASSTSSAGAGGAGRRRTNTRGARRRRRRRAIRGSREEGGWGGAVTVNRSLRPWPGPGIRRPRVPQARFMHLHASSCIGRVVIRRATACASSVRHDRERHGHRAGSLDANRPAPLLHAVAVEDEGPDTGLQDRAEVFLLRVEPHRAERGMTGSLEPHVGLEVVLRLGVGPRLAHEDASPDARAQLEARLLPGPDRDARPHRGGGTTRRPRPPPRCPGATRTSRRCRVRGRGSGRRGRERGRPPGPDGCARGGSGGRPRSGATSGRARPSGGCGGFRSLPRTAGARGPRRS